MAVITIDHKPFEVDQHKNLLECTISLGLDVPYFCWHPALGSVGSCRLCAVQQMADENDKVGRTVMACMTPVKDQARFSVVHPTAKDFRAAVVEWLMTNHPHDCPVCDEGGECHLQDMTLLTGHNYRNYRFLKRTFRNQNLGPFINHEMNRCITCYRCVRYYRDVAGGSDLSAFKSSGKVYFGRFSDGNLSSEFSGNLVEICPTGVFTDKTYHQRYVRKWDLATSPSLCQLCGVGCNIALGERGGILRRVQNRYHHDINGFFICDRGRFGHDYVNSDRRLVQHYVKHDGNLMPVSPQDALSSVKKLLAQSKNVIGIGSATASLEANFLLKRLVGADNFYDARPLATSLAINEAVTTLKERVVEPASLRNVREADAVLIVGEDLTNTAPIVALALRQAAMAFKQRTSQQELNIDTWNDAAVRDFARGDLLPVMSINAFATALDGLCHEAFLTHPLRIASILNALEEALLDRPISTDLPKAALAFIEQVKAALLAAKNPVIIAGTSLGDPLIIQRAKSMASALTQRNNETRLSLVMPDPNNVGLKLLNPKDLVSQKMAVDVAIVLENDLRWHLGSKPFSALCHSVKNLVVLDNLPNDTTKAATIVIPTLSFLEASGSMINSEGRLQRYYAAAEAKAEVATSFDVLASLLAEKSQISYTALDAVSKELAQDLGIPEDSFSKTFDAHFRLLDQKIPRQTSEASGRTALNANNNVHEQKPPSDPDSPFAFSMEGARKKIPLPLISSSWLPKWNSLQSSFKTILSKVAQEPDAFGGVRLFSKRDREFSRPIYVPIEKKLEEAPNFYVVPKYHIFSSFAEARFSSSLATRMPENEAEMSPIDAKKLGFTEFAPIVLESEHGKFSLLAKTKDDVPLGVILLPFGLVDSALFFSTCLCRVVSKEQV